ncbi:MAG: hypothetical protein QOG64_2358 [Acidimicrobiaceae bacterium]|jgi:hypothetical protein|nr:hypothetical protein [Acidimicrobiaceae bacterium]
MRFRLGLVVGFGAGYYLGTKAGRERHEEINRAIRKLKRSDAYETATDKARAVVDLSVERAKDVIDDKIGGNGSTEPPVGKTWPDRMDPIVRP